jgi:hypothetical protein
VENYRLIRSLKCEGNPVATEGHHSSRFSSSGSFAMLAAMRRASSSVNTFACIASSIAHDIAAGHLFGAPGCRESAGRHAAIIILVQPAH